MISRAIDFDPFAETIEEKIFRNAKRLCIVFSLTTYSVRLVAEGPIGLTPTFPRK